MSSSSVPLVEQLTAWRTHLDSLISTDADVVVPGAQQLEIENAIAGAVAELAGEPEPAPATGEPQRSILAKDLRITTDLVLRALQTHTT